MMVSLCASGRALRQQPRSWSDPCMGGLTVTDSSAEYGVQQLRICVRPCVICTSFPCLEVRTSAKARACTGLRSLRSGAPHRLPHSVRADERHAEEVTGRESDLERHVA